jgi:hypothetical protein
VKDGVGDDFVREKGCKGLGTMRELFQMIRTGLGISASADAGDIWRLRRGML